LGPGRVKLKLGDISSTPGRGRLAYFSDIVTVAVNILYNWVT